MKLPLLITCLVAACTLFGQSNGADGFYKDYNWKKIPEKYTVSEEDKKEDEVIVFEKRSVEICSDAEGNYVQMMLVHTIRLLNTDQAIEDNNKVYIANGPESHVYRQQARVIKPDGKIIELNEADIQESKDENGEVEYRYFALDGIEKECYVEYLHYIARSPNFPGASLTWQSEVPKKHVEVDLICPKSLEFQIYPINGMPEFQRDSSTLFVRRMYAEKEELPGLKEEPWSPHDALLQKCYYKVNRNLNAGTANFYNYAAVTKKIHENMYDTPSKKTKKVMQKFIADAVKDQNAPLEQKIRALENKLKSEINTLDFSFEGVFDVDFVMANKVTNEEGMTKLMVQMLREMGVKHELVLTSDKTEDPFLTEFEGYNFLQEDLIYINELDMYLSPNRISRLGFPPYSITDTKGLFIREINLDGMVTAVGKVKDIKGTKGEQSVDEINTEVTFTNGMSECSVQLERITSGYKAEFPQALLHLMDEDRKKEALDDYLLYIDKEAKLENTAYENASSDVSGVKPLIGRATINGSSFIEKAGDKTLLKAGMLIGPQAELYNQEKRTQPVNTGYTRQYKRTIRIHIPEGQTVKNPEDAVFNVKPDSTGNSTGFVSSYEIKGDEMIITVFEYYNRTSYTAEEYTMYEAVMNAAADFNKVVLVFDKP